MVAIKDDPEVDVAHILAPPNAEEMSDGDWLNVIAAASEMGNELSSLGFLVRG